MVLLDPVSYPGAIKAFAKEVCRNDLLNFGRLHFFFPDSRLALDLNTDKTLKVTVLSFWTWVLNRICIDQCCPQQQARTQSYLHRYIRRAYMSSLR